MTTTIRGTDNSAAAPALTGNDSDTGIYFPAADTLGLVTGGTERVSVTSTGNVAIANGNLVFSTNGTGIDFSASAGGGASSSLLDDYEEGTFTVTTAGDATGAFSAEEGEYTKIGNVCTVRITFDVSVNFTSNSIGGLPFQPKDSSAISSLAGGFIALTSVTSGSPIIVAPSVLNTNLAFFSETGTSSPHLLNTTNNVYRIQFTYRTA